MYVDFDALNPSEAYFAMTQAIVPRPIAWVLSENAGGDYNLAPFSYFNAVCSDPPLVMLSLGKKPDGSAKDTRVNIEARNEFTIHIPHSGQLQTVNDSSATLPSGVSEVTELGLELTSFVGARLPRLVDCRLAMACELYEIKEIGDAAQTLIFGRVHQLYVDDAVAEVDARERLKIHPEQLDPLGRLGAGDYFSGGQVLSLTRPK